MIGASVRVLRNDFPRIEARFEPGVADDINRGVFDTIAVADPLTRVDTGALRSNKQLDMAAPGNLSARITWAQDYAWYQNDGTVYMSGTRYATIAADQVFPTVQANIAARIGGLS